MVTALNIDEVNLLTDNMGQFIDSKHPYVTCSNEFINTQVSLSFLFSIVFSRIFSSFHLASILPSTSLIFPFSNSLNSIIPPSKEKTPPVQGRNTSRILAKWKEENILEKTIENRKDNETWVFYDGPIYANAKPGIHHVLAKTIKDSFCKYKTMKGYKVLRNKLSHIISK